MNNNLLDLYESIQVVDVETNNLDPLIAEILEVAVVKPICDKDLFDVYIDTETYSELFRPNSNNIPPETSAVNHITMNMVRDKDVFSVDCEIAKKVNTDYIFVSHNTSFDIPILTSHGLNIDRSICTRRWATKLLQDDDSVVGYSLSYLVYKFGLYVDGRSNANFHSASFDALICFRLFQYLTNTMCDMGLLDVNYSCVDQILNYLSEPIIYKYMPFGKYKRCEFSVIPIDYIKWALNTITQLNPESDDYDNDLYCTFYHEIEKRYNSKS